ncbi:MAG: regulator of sigma E protease [Alphaproteobacteria bacterium]|nr:regulator of sigma E protease [Alphaproteobacteria bacterium]
MISGDILIYISAFLLVLTVVVFFHELGHFLVARLCGVRVETFAIGFGRELLGWDDRHGTRWKIGWLPLGGYVKFWGDESAASTPDTDQLQKMSEADRSVSFHHKPVGNRMAIVAAGPVSNFVLGILIFAALFMIMGRTTILARVDQVQPGSAAEQAGFLPGDVVLAIDGVKIEGFSELQRRVMLSAGETLNVLVEREDQQLTLTVVPRIDEFTDAFGNVQRRGLIGLVRANNPEDQVVEIVGPVRALIYGAQETWFIVDQTFVYLGRMIMGKESTEQLGGPLRIAQMSGQVAQISVSALVHLMAVLSVSIGLLNLFPVPMLDGGHLVFYAIEAVWRRPVNQRVLDFSYRIGFAAITTLIVFVTWNDLVNLRVVDFLASLFS